MSILRAEYLASWFLRMCCQNFIFAVVLSNHIQQISQPVVVIVTNIGTKEGLGYRARRIGCVKRGNQRSQYLFCKVGFGSVVNFISGAIDHNARVVAVAPNRIAGVYVGPFFEIEVIVERSFSDRPTVKQLVHDDETHAITKIEKLRSRWVMCGANSVHAEVSENFQAAFPDPQGNSCAKCTSVVVQTNAFQLEVAPIEPESCICIEANLANTECQSFIVESCCSLANSNNGPVEMWIFQVPALWIPNYDILIKSSGCSGGNILRLRFCCLHGTPLRIENDNL